MSASGSLRFDSVLLVSFGGPNGPADILPFLERVLHGRRVAPDRVEEVARHYEHFGGVSPITELTRKQAEGLRERLAAAGHPLPVYVGMRNWHPLLPDTLKEMYEAGARNAVGFIAAAHHCYSSCQQYRENVADARTALRQATGGDIDITYVKSWFDHPSFVEANAAHVREALWRLPLDLRMSARLVFTAHSIPASMAEASRYEDQLSASAAAVAEAVGLPWALVYQSRSGRPADPWLEPDVCEYLRRERAAGLQAAILCPIGFVCDHIEVLYDLDREGAAGLEAAILCPIGFVCDHIEVLYDLDREAAGVCRDIGLTMVRAEAVNDDPLFLDMMADVVIETIDWYEGGRPLPLAAR